MPYNPRSTPSQMADPGISAEARIIVNQLSDAFDALVDLLCLSAREGPNDERAQRYLALRDRTSTACREVAIRLAGLNDMDAASDPIAAFLTPQDLQDAVNVPGAIEQIISCRDYLAELEQCPL